MRIDEKILLAIDKGLSEALDFSFDDTDDKINKKIGPNSAKSAIGSTTLEKMLYDAVDMFHMSVSEQCEISEHIWQLIQQGYTCVANDNNIKSVVTGAINALLINPIDHTKWTWVNEHVIDLNWINTSNVTNMKKLFSSLGHQVDISEWDVSNVRNMSEMFAYSDFNGDISKWNTQNVEDMKEMFKDSNFNGDISKWDVSNVVNMKCMFAGSKFNQNISMWNVKNVIHSWGFYNGSATYENDNIGKYSPHFLK